MNDVILNEILGTLQGINDSIDRQNDQLERLNDNIESIIGSFNNRTFLNVSATVSEQ